MYCRYLMAWVRRWVQRNWYCILYTVTVKAIRRRQQREHHLQEHKKKEPWRCQSRPTPMEQLRKRNRSRETHASIKTTSLISKMLIFLFLFLLSSSLCSLNDLDLPFRYDNGFVSLAIEASVALVFFVFFYLAHGGDTY